jgi:hypothetical protein
MRRKLAQELEARDNAMIEVDRPDSVNRSMSIGIGASFTVVGERPRIS